MSGDAHRQRGQVFLVFVLFAMALLLALWVLYDAGSLNVEKMRLRNTADNTAYSASVMVARNMNFVAYTNRAMVANQVSVAQAVGMSSWAHMMRQVANNVALLVSRFPPFKPAASAVAGGSNAMAAGVDEFAKAMIWASDEMVGALSAAQVIFHTAAVAAAVDLALEVTKRNDPDVTHLATAAGEASMSSVMAMAGWWDERIGQQNQVPGPDPEDEAEELALKRFNEFEAVTKASRDPFSKKRSYRWPPPFTNPLSGTVGPDWKSEKYGGSDLFRRVNGDGKWAWEWAAMDTVGLHVRTCFVIDCSDWEKLPFPPLGWGAAHALHQGADGDFFAYTYPGAHGYGGNRQSLWGNGAWRNELEAMLASSTVDTTYEDYTFYGDGDNNLRNIEGFRPYYDFKSDGPVDDGPAVTVLLAKADNKMATQKSWPERYSDFEIAEELNTEKKGGMLKARMAALSKAQPYFARAYDLKGWRRKDGKYEHGNLYNPFWQVHLIDPSDEERAAALAVASGWPS